MATEPTGAAGETPRVDVVVIGAGLGGTAAATVIARAGYRVALVESHAVHPPKFRAEKLGATTGPCSSGSGWRPPPSRP